MKKSLIIVVIILVLSIGLGMVLFLVRGESSNSPDFKVYNRKEKKLILEDEDISLLIEMIDLAVIDSVTLERPKYVYSNKLVYRGLDGEHIVRFTAPSLVLEDNEAVIIFDDHDIGIDMTFYSYFDDISRKNDFSLEVD